MTTGDARTDSLLTARIIRSVEEIEDVRDVWVRWQKHLHCDIDFYLRQECAAPGFVRPHIIVLYRDGNPEAMWVGKLIHARVGDFRIGSWIVWKSKLHVLRMPEAGLLGNPTAQHCETFVREIMAALDRKEADMATLRGVREDNPVYRCAMTLPRPLQRDHVVETRLHCSAKLPASIEEIYAGWTAKSRKNLKWQAKQLVNAFAGDVTVRCFRESSELERMMQDVEAVARKAWQRAAGEEGFRDNAETRQRFLFEAQKGWLRAYVLYLAGSPSAFWRGALYGGTFHTIETGYDPEFQQHSIGTYLLVKVLEDLCRQGVKVVDFDYGQQMYKQRFGNCEWREAEICLFGQNLRGMSLSLLRIATRKATGFTKWFLSASKLTPKTKRAWRSAPSVLWRINPHRDR